MEGDASYIDPKHDALQYLFWKDEILQVMFWLQGEEIAKAVSLKELTIMLNTDEATLQFYLNRLQQENLVQAQENGHEAYTLTAEGRKEAGMRFASAFEGMQKSGHGECSADCDCQWEGHDQCSHRHHHS